MSQSFNTSAVKLNAVKDYVKANVKLQCEQLHAPRLAIQGPPGVGKSDIIRELCEENGWALSVKYLSNMSLEQITGIPCKVESGSTAVWSKPELFNFDNPEYEPECGMSDKVVKVLLIDDFHLADRIMQKYLFQILTYKSLNGYKLPENTAIILAGNRNTDRALANPIPAPVCNRLMFIEVKSDLQDWLNNFAFKHGVRNDITSYLYQYGDERLSSEPLESGAWASPRAWTYLSYQMDTFEKMFGKLNITELKNMASGLVGTENAVKFIEYRELFAKWNFNELFRNGTKHAFKQFEAEVNKNITDVYAIISAGTSWLLNIYRDNDYDIDKKEVQDAVQFLYECFMFLMLFPNQMIQRNTRPLIVAGTRYIHMYNEVVSKKRKINIKQKSLLRAFMVCLKNETDADLIFYELLCNIFDLPIPADEQEQIKAAKKKLKYTL